MRNEYLKILPAAFDCAQARLVMPRFDAFGTLLANADLPQWFYSALAIAGLAPVVKTALTAEDAAAGRDPDVRPVAVGHAVLRAVTSCVTQQSLADLASELAPQQLAVGISGGISVLIHGIRLTLEETGSHVVVRLDLRNAYNACDRAAVLRRLERSGFSATVPLSHACSAEETELLVGGAQRPLFEGETRGASSTGVRQGSVESSPDFAILIQPNLRSLDAELRIYDGYARAIMDDVYAVGPAEVVFAAVARFARGLREVGLELQVGKTSCYSREYDLEACPWRQQFGAPVGGQVDAAGTMHRGVMVGGAPLGEDGYVELVLGGIMDEIVSYIDTTVIELRSYPHLLWSALFYCIQSRFDFWLRHVPPAHTTMHARRLDERVLRAVEEITYDGMLGDALTRARFRLPSRLRGCGVRSREGLAPAAYCACFVEAAEVFLDRQGAAGQVVPGFFPGLATAFGRGAFDAGGHRLQQYLAGTLPSSLHFMQAWQGMTAEVLASGTTGPLEQTADQAGAGRSAETRLQRAITQQRERYRCAQLDGTMLSLPHGDTRREAWQQCDTYTSAAWVTAWPDEDVSVAPSEMGEMIATYLGRESPLCRALAGRSIPCTRVRRICDPHGQQLGLAQLTDRAHSDLHDALLSCIYQDARQAGLTGSKEPRHLFSAVLPPQVLAQPRQAIVPDMQLRAAMPTAATARGQSAGRMMASADLLWDLKTIHGGANPWYTCARARDERGGATAERAHRVHADYVSAARRWDVQLHAGHSPGGPIESALQAHGTVRSLVFGQYAEASADVHSLIQAIATEAADAMWRDMGARSRTEARAFFLSHYRRRWGLLAAREYARHRIRRVPYIGMPRGYRMVGGHGAAGGAAPLAAAFAAQQGLQQQARGGI